MARITGTVSDDFIHLNGDGRTPPPGANDIPEATNDGDRIVPNGGDDTIFGGRGSDTTLIITGLDADAIDLERGRDVLLVRSASEVRLTFTSAEVGNGNSLDSDLLANQDGGLAVRLNTENGSDVLTGPTTRTDDEGITFSAQGGFTFDVRDLVSGAQRGNAFGVVTLGSTFGERIAVETGRNTYINAGMGDDRVVGGTGRDFLVGGAGNDRLNGREGADSLLGGGGDDNVKGGQGVDTAIFNVTTDGADQTNLSVGDDLMNVAATVPTEVRLTFTSSEVGNGVANDAGTMMNQDGGLAVRLSAEDGSDGLTGPVSRVDDEGIRFVGGTGVTFDVRDLVAGTQRGNAFTEVALGTAGADVVGLINPVSVLYANAGAGNDLVRGGAQNDVLVGGAGIDKLFGLGGNDTFVIDRAEDVVREVAGGGTDTVLSAVTATLADKANVENLTLVGTAATNGSGNVLANTIVGNTAANTIDGGRGSDFLTGGAGGDLFTFTGTFDGVDTITDFLSGSDSLGLDADLFDLPAGPLDDEAFATGTAASEADDRIVFDAASGNVSYDRDGAGGVAAVTFARLDTGVLTADDVIVI